MWRCDCGSTVFLRAMPSRSEGRRTFVGLTGHGRLEGKHESRLRSSPAEGLTVTKAEPDRRGEAGVVPPPHPLWQGGGLQGEAGGRAFIKGRIRGCSPCLHQGAHSGVFPVPAAGAHLRGRTPVV